jgi:NAD(P)-dependent dehydrogenase (short-subunit alcohol dehydrogenase family)
MASSQTPITLVTGASRGIGTEIAKRLVVDGHHVIGTSRSGLPIVDGVDMRPLDLTDRSSVQNLVDSVIADHGRIDVMVNNAAQTIVAPAEELPIDGAQALLDVNYLGPIRLTQEILPHMRSRQGGRLVFISSLGGLIGIPGQGQYCASKHALEGWADALSLEMRQFGIHVSLVEPSSYRTDIITTSPRPDWETLDVYDGYREHLLDSIEAMTADGGNPASVANVVSKVVAARSPKLRYRTEMDGRMANFFRRTMPERAFYNTLAKRFGAARPVAA